MFPRKETFGRRAVPPRTRVSADDTGNVIQGNEICTDVTWTPPFPNSGAGIALGGEGDDLMICGRGADRPLGDADEDIPIAVQTAFDADDLALHGI